jgi:hypothetical protein
MNNIIKPELVSKILSQIKHNRKVEHKYYVNKRKGYSEGFDGERNQSWIDTLDLYQGELYIDRNWYSRDGEHLDVDDVTDLYLEEIW